MKLSTYLHLVPWLKMNGAIPLLRLHTFMVWAGIIVPLLLFYLWIYSSLSYLGYPRFESWPVTSFAASGSVMLETNLNWRLSSLSSVQCNILPGSSSIWCRDENVELKDYFKNWNTLFAWIQDDSNLRRPPKNKSFAKKKYFTISCILLIHKHVRFYLPLPISATASIFTVSAFIIFTLTPNIPILFTAIPQRIIISPIHFIRCTALLKSLHTDFWWYALPCCTDPHGLNNTFIFLCL